ncbi:nucleotidyltransferase domain-containing protein [Brevibacillus agri]|uniref:nucleotidyltransferase domain-containing protein n=1 Tax=Brevibacillus agri TaxID=51101 RepID=UPI001EE60657|nr:nucleotidyltransferase domain-containing protein [Brevibacillus agri]MCG5250684.1 nucleotidyltransferase domain-containing protein [Brevibacillus agri]MDN4092389.1 nucleotidyltransferase domain-containing protein [Brevibacillus agri]MED1643346.1 nucleotidyltransferase domain-containing protein [Brevibacillus agri]MED1653435.1 nucleotidyltransferase domain-containing protein [Brevibacillus agri]MED1685324.1 nucleotidyltransferase domain-containing protein [Brevibacillus agri]
MQELIRQKLLEIEKEHELKVLFAVESGSRAWGFPSQDSDYDVRFVYVKKPEWYLSIDDKRDVVELPIDETLDISGWDIRKALKLFRKSNPALHEWLASGIVYRDELGFRAELIQMRNELFSPKTALLHYLSMANGNYRKDLQGDHVRIKKYFYVLRPILACEWIEKYRTNPPLLFQQLVAELVTDADLRREIDELLHRKMEGDELDLEPRIDVIHAYIDDRLERLSACASEYAGSMPDQTARLDELYRRYLRLAWPE